MLRIAELLAKHLQRAKLVTIEGGSHFLPATHPAELAALITTQVKTEPLQKELPHRTIPFRRPGSRDLTIAITGENTCSVRMPGGGLRGLQAIPGRPGQPESDFVGLKSHACSTKHLLTSSHMPGNRRWAPVLERPINPCDSLVQRRIAIPGV